MSSPTKVRYGMKSLVKSGIVVAPTTLAGPSLTVNPDPMYNTGFLGVAVLLPPSPPPTSIDPNPEQCTLVAYLGIYTWPTTVNIPGGGEDWIQAFLVYLPNGVSTPPGYASLFDAITEAIQQTTSPAPTDGTGE
jgi:hypothetical protein